MSIPEAAFVEYIAELHRAVHAVGLFLQNRLGDEFSQPEALVILHLAAAGTSTINDLHHAFLHRRSTLTSVLDRLEKKSLVRRVSLQGDRRSVGITLTPRGKKAAARVQAALGELQRLIQGSGPPASFDNESLHTVAEAASAHCLDASASG